MSYDASNIVIIEHDQLSKLFMFSRINDLCERYTSFNTVFIKRLVEACQLSGFDESLAIQRYLERDKSIEVTPEFVECYKELMNESRSRSR